VTIIVVFCAVRSQTEFSGIADEVRLVFQRLSDMPAVMDLSNGTGDRPGITSTSPASVVIGCDALIVAVHSGSTRLLPDEDQFLNIAEFEQLLFNIRQIACDPGRQVPTPCGALTIKPGTELAAALVSELAPFLATEEW
jgi:3-deoxy-D-arabino-heptulosonate 7-phosphate (DAHP) synthase